MNASQSRQMYGFTLVQAHLCVVPCCFDRGERILLMVQAGF